VITTDTLICGMYDPRKHMSQSITARRIFTVLLAVFLVYGIIALYGTPSAHSFSDLHLASNVPITRKVWQTWRVPFQEMDEELQRLSRTWIDMNPEYRYELLTDDSAATYVRAKFARRPDIQRMFERTRDPILRADLTRYLALLADGGIYSDIDTDCSRPIDSWIPPEYQNRTGLVVGVEYDVRDEALRADMELRVQLCQWTFMAKPGHPVMQHVVDRITAKLSEFDQGQGDGNGIQTKEGNVMELTGPRVGYWVWHCLPEWKLTEILQIFTRAVLEGTSKMIGTPVTDAEITKLTEPKLFGDVLVMPVSAFASGQEHSGSKPWGNSEQLMSHHFRGFSTWKPAHEQAS
jgi:alpha 1,6-mannosyltransferase